MVLLGDEAQVEAHFGPFGDSANLDIDRCMVCAERTIRSEIDLDANNGSPWWLGHVESCFSPFGDSIVSVQDR